MQKRGQASGVGPHSPTQEGRGKVDHVRPPAADVRPTSDPTSYLWSDLLARRNALALHREDLVELLQVNWGKYWTRESSSRPVSPTFIGELLAMEEFVREETGALLASAPATAGPVVLQALEGQGEFERKYPDERTLRDGRPYPAALHDVAVGRAAADLTRRGYSVEVYRGPRRADLTVRRRATGLLKNETAELLGIAKQKYYKWESGKIAPAAGLIAELQAVNDFITAVAAQLNVADVGGVRVIQMLDEQDEFEHAYPNARTKRDGRAYPVRMHRVAAARRASALEGAGEEARVAVTPARA